MTDLWPTLQRSQTSSRKDLQRDLFREYDDEDNEPTVDESTAEKGYMCAACDDGGCIETFGNEVICTMCGTIVDIPIEHGAEYRWFSNDNHNNGSGSDPSRCSFPVNHLMPESSLGTMILSRGGGDGSGMMRRIKRYHLWNQMPPPLTHSSHTVSNAVPRLSPGISHLTYITACARFTPSNSD